MVSRILLFSTKKPGERIQCDVSHIFFSDWVGLLQPPTSPKANVAKDANVSKVRDGSPRLENWSSHSHDFPMAEG